MQNSEEGFSILQVIWIAGVLAIASVVISRSLLQTKLSAKIADTRNMLEVFTPRIQSHLRSVITNNLNPINCYRPADFDLSTHLAEGTLDLLFATDIKAGLTGRSFQKYLSQTKVVTAGQRCANPRSITSPTTDQSLYFCQRLAQDPLAPNNSIVGSPHSFIEVRLDFIEVATDSPLSCSQYLATASAGIKARFLVHWQPANRSLPRYLQAQQTFITVKGP